MNHPLLAMAAVVVELSIGGWQVSSSAEELDDQLKLEWLSVYWPLFVQWLEHNAVVS